MSAAILQFPLRRRLSPQAAHMVEVAAQSAATMGRVFDRQEATLIIQSWLRVKGDPAFVDRIKHAIAERSSHGLQP